MCGAYPKRLLMAALVLVSSVTGALAQVDARLQPGTRVRVWLPEAPRQSQGPWHRQLLRGNLSELSADSLWLAVPGAGGRLALARTEVRRIDVSRGTSRLASALERAFALGVTFAIATALDNDPQGKDWPHYRSDWRAAQQGAWRGAAAGAVIGFVIPTERWRKISLR